MSTHHRAHITRFSLLAAAVTVASYSSALAADLTVPGTHATLQDAVAAAADSDRIILGNGTHTLTTTLQVNKAITIEGESRAGTIINAVATGAGWGINVDSSNVTLKNFTVLPPAGPGTRGTGSGGAFAIHAGYHWDVNPALRTPHTNLTLQDITVDDSNRTAFDIHGVDNVTLSGLTATDAAYGNGISLSGCTNVTITGCTTSGNAWGGVAVYASKSSNLNRPSSNVNFSFTTNNIGEFFYVEKEEGLVSTANVTGATYQIDNAYNPPLAAQAYYTDGILAEATALAQGLNAKYSNTASVLNTASGDTLVVPGLSLQAAINAASPDDTITVSGAITVTSPVSLNKKLIIDGGDKTTTSISGSNALAGYFMLASGAAGGSTVKNISFIKTDKAGAQNMIGLQAPNIAFEDCHFSGQYVLGDADVSRAFEISSTASGFRIEDCSITGLRQPAYINAVSSGQVLNNHVAGTRGWVVDGGLVEFNGNSWGTGSTANAVDIALLNGTPTSPLYDPLATLIANNNNATISNQRAAAQVFNATKGIGYPTIQAAINAADNGDSITVYAGTFNEDVVVNKDVTLQGAGVGQSIISGPIGGESATVRIGADGVTVTGFTITRAGNTAASWTNGSLNSAGIAIQGGVTGALVNDNLITGNRSAIDVNNSSGHIFSNNVITENHTGVIFRNQTNSITFVENSVVANRTVGVLFLDASSGSNSPVQTAASCNFSNNDISGNWYGQVVDRQAGGSLPAPGTTNLKNFEGNWYGTSVPVVSTANSAEPAYDLLVPVYLGGTATAPAAQPHIAGPASANLDYKSYLSIGLDTNVETVPGRGTYGFQGKQSSLWDGTTVSETISGEQTYTNLFVPAGKTITITPTGSLVVTGKLELAPGASIVVNGGELVIGEDSKISGTFTVFNSFGSWNINGDTTFEIGRSLALVTDIHVAAGAVVTVNGGGELILDGCVIDSQTPGSPYSVQVEADGLLTIARSVVSDASIDINTEASSVPEFHRSKVYDSRFADSEIEASASSAVYHNLFDTATNGASNTDGSTAFDAVDGWGNVTDANLMKNQFSLEFAAPLLSDRTLDDGNLFVQTGDAVKFDLNVGSLAPNTITLAEALLGYNSERLTLVPGPTAVVPASGWNALIDDDSVSAPLGLVDSALSLNLASGDDGIAGPATLGSVNFTAGTAGATVGFFRVQTDGNYSPDGSFMQDTRLTKSSGGIPSFLTPFTANTGELVVDNEVPVIAVPAVSGVQTQPTVGSTSILQPTSNVVIRGQALAPVILTFTATDAGLAGLDAGDATNDLVLTADNSAGTILDSDDYTVTATESSGVVTYVVSLNIPAGAGNGTYAISAVVQDRSGNDSAPANLGSFVIANEVLATVELQGFVGTGPASLRDVTFVATGGTTTKTWVKTVSFTSSTGTVVLDNVPAGTTGISAKTPWTLRSKKPVSLAPAGAGSVVLTGIDKLNGGDLNNDNVVNTLDFSILRYYWLSSVSGNPAAGVADITGEGMVNGADYNVLVPNFYTAGDAQ